MLALVPEPGPPAVEPMPLYGRLASEDDLGAEASQEMSPEPSMRHLLEVVSEMHRALAEQLAEMDQRMIHIQDIQAHMIFGHAKRVTSVTSNASQKPKPSNSAKKLQVRDNLAMEALQLDISKLVPSHSTGSESWSLTAFKKKDKVLTDKRHETNHEVKSRTRSPGALDRSRAKVKESPGSARPNTLELPGEVAIAGSDCDNSAPPSDQRQTTYRSAVSDNEMMEKAMEKGEKGSEKGSIRNSPRSMPMARVGSVQSLRSQEKPNQKVQSLHSSGRDGSINRSRRSSQEMRRAVSKANITEVFKLKEAQLTAALRSPTPQSLSPMKGKPKPESPSPAKGVNGDTASESASEAETLVEVVEVEQVEEAEPESLWLRLSPLNTFMCCHFSKLLGLVPLFHPREESQTWLGFFKELVSRLYHWSLILLLLGFLVRLLWGLSFCHNRSIDAIHASQYVYDEDHEGLCNSAWPPLAVDVALLMGGILVLMSWGGFFNYRDTTKLVAQSAEELTSYCEQTGLGTAWKAWSCKDALWTLLLWLLLVVARYALSAWAVASDGEASFEDWGTWRAQRVQVPHVVTVQVMGVLVVASFWQVRTSHAMLLILNWWSANLLTGQVSCMEAKREWRGVSGLFRKTSRTFEHCFAALASLIVILALCALYDLRQGHNSGVVCGAAAVMFFIPGVLWTHARTTTACKRLPSLVTLCEVEDEEQDAEYMGLAMYLSLSECGFFVWDTCVTVAFVQKFMYFASALAGTIGFQTGAFQLS